MAGRNSRNKGKTTVPVFESKKITTTRKGRRGNKAKKTTTSTDVLPVTRNTPASGTRKKAPNYSTSGATGSTSKMPETRSGGTPKTIVKGSAGVVRKPGSAANKAPSTSTPSPSTPKARKVPKKAPVKARKASSVKLMTPAEAKRVKEARMEKAVAAGRKPKMNKTNIRTAAMPRKKRKYKTSRDEFMGN